MANKNIEQAKEKFGLIMQEQLDRIEEMKKSAAVVDYNSLSPVIIGICFGDGIGEIISKHSEAVLKHVLKDEFENGKIVFKDIDGLTIENRAAQKKAIPEDVLEELKASHRKATVRDIAKSVLIQQRICTTKAKAKEAKKLVDKLITMGKKATLAEKRRAFAILCNHKLVSELFNKIAPPFGKRNGGYTRIIPYANRRGDNAELVFLELTEKREVIVSKPKTKKAVKKDNVKPAEDVSEKDQEDKKEKVKTDKAKETKTETVKNLKKDAAKHGKDAGKPKKNIVGGLKNIFKKKSSDK